MPVNTESNYPKISEIINRFRKDKFDDTENPEKHLRLETGLDKSIRTVKVGDQSTPLDISSEKVNYKGCEIAIKNDLHDSTVGSVIGYTRIADNTTTTGNDTITIGTSFATLQTVGGTDVSITFTAPLSGNVEILFSAYVYSSSKTVSFGLSDNSSYNELDEIHTYDNLSLIHI